MTHTTTSWLWARVFKNDKKQTIKLQLSYFFFNKFCPSSVKNVIPESFWNLFESIYFYII